MQAPHLSTCPRCDHELELVVPWRGFRYVRRAWIAGVVVIVVLAPILASDIMVMMPLSVVYLFAGGPVLGLAKLQPTCRTCGLALPAPGLRPRLVRGVRGLSRATGRTQQAAAPKLPAPAPAAEVDEQSGVRPLPGRKR